MVSYTPFIVYATDTPCYPSGEMWGYEPFPLRYRSRYGCTKRTELFSRLLHQPREISYMDGSLIVLSGGHLSQVGGMVQPEICMSGSLDMQHFLGDRFAERAISEMIDPDARVTMVLYVSLDEAFEHLATVRQAGFEVIVTGDVTPGVDSNFAVCLGTAEMLKAYEWLSQVWGYEPYFFIANKGPQSIIERAIVDAAINKKNPESVAVDLMKQVENAPETANEILGQQYIHISFTDPDVKSLLIMRQESDISSLEDIFRKTAKEVGISLYDAASLRLPDRDGHYFTEYKSWEECVQMPEFWTKIV